MSKAINFFRGNIYNDMFCTPNTLHTANKKQNRTLIVLFYPSNLNGKEKNMLWDCCNLIDYQSVTRNYGRAVFEGRYEKTQDISSSMLMIWRRDDMCVSVPFPVF